jgi:hypothetical protein
MKSGVQLNFIERRVRADHALSQLVKMTRDKTETLSSREQRGFYHLESIPPEKSDAALPEPRVWTKAAWAARWLAFETVLIAFVQSLWTGACFIVRTALARARARWVCDLAPIFITLRVGFARMIAALRKLRGRDNVHHDAHPRAAWHRRAR